MQWYSHWNPPQETQTSTQFSHRNMGGFSQSHCCKEALRAGRAQGKGGEGTGEEWGGHRAGADSLGGMDLLGLPFASALRNLNLNGTVMLTSACFRIKWSQRALTWQSDPSCYGTTFGSAAIPRCPLHGLTIFDPGTISCSLLSHNGRASFPCPWHCPKRGTWEFPLARPRINTSSSHRPCSPG